MTQALQYTKQALKLNPNLSDVHNNLGLVYGIMGDYKKAIAHLKQAIKINPRNSEAQFNLKKVMNDKKRR